MQLLSAIAGFVVVAIATLLLFRGMRLPKASLLFSREDAAAFRSQTGKGLQPFLVSASFFGTLTSLATVYIFFLGTSKVFGWYIFAAPLTLVIGAFVTNAVTRRVFAQSEELRLAQHEGAREVGVVARVVWTDTVQGRQLSTVVKWLSIVAMLGILWLEFSVFADILSSLSPGGPTSPVAAAGMLAGAALVVCFLILRFGLRGFVFADVLQSPLIVLGTLAVFAGLGWLVAFSPADAAPPAFVPLAPQPTPILFVLHVLAVNCAFVLVSEAHWFRLWLFNEQETQQQVPSSIYTALLWALLALAGCLAVAVTVDVGNGGTVAIVSALSDLSGVYAFMFWLAASAALFSTADAQIYSLLVTAAYRPRVGRLSDTVDRPGRVLRISLLIALGFAALYLPVRHFGLPMEKIVFALTPLPANIFPALLAVAYRRSTGLFWTVCSLVGYACLTIVGFGAEETALAWTLGAALVPFGASAFMLLTSKELPR